MIWLTRLFVISPMLVLYFCDETHHGLLREPDRRRRVCVIDEPDSQEGHLCYNSIWPGYCRGSF